MTEMQARDLPLICPNPDRTVQFGDKVIYCGGAVAEQPEQQMGSQVELAVASMPALPAQLRNSPLHQYQYSLRSWTSSAWACGGYLLA